MLVFKALQRGTLLCIKFLRKPIWLAKLRKQYRSGLYLSRMYPKFKGFNGMNFAILGRIQSKFHADWPVWAPKKCLQKVKSKDFLILVRLLTKQKIYKIIQFFSCDNPFKCGTRISSCDSSLDKTKKWLQRRIQNPVKHLRRRFLRK